MSDETGGVVVRMPKLADTLVEGTVARWLKAVGDEVRKGEPLAEIETDKVSTELVAPAAGVLAELIAPEGQPVPVESAIARISGSVGASTQAEAPWPLPASESEPIAAPPAPVEGPPKKASPVAARMLAELGLAPHQVPVEADGGARRLMKDDVLRYVGARQPREAPAPPPAPPPGATPSTLQPLSSMRRSIADHMARARATIPHGQTAFAADLTALAAWRDAEKDRFQAREGGRLTFTVLFLAALASALREQAASLPLPQRDGHPAIDLGVAVALDAGLVVPVVRDADRLTLGELARALDASAERARAGRLTPDDVQGAVMTLTNVGSFGNLAAFPIIPLRQLGILGPGIVEPRPFPTADGGIRPGLRCVLSLVFDRRVFDDLAADRFLAGVVRALDAIPRQAALA